jgi:hypothetical protein
MSGGHKQLKRDHQACVHSDKMILMSSRQGAGHRWSKTLRTKLNLKGDYQAQVHSGQDGSHGSQARIHDRFNSGQKRSNAS